MVLWNFDLLWKKTMVLWKKNYGSMAKTMVTVLYRNL